MYTLKQEEHCNGQEKAAATQLMERLAEQERKEKVERYKRLNKLARKGQILFCGSSLMEQFPIHELLVDAGQPLHVYNRGVGGYTTTELAQMLDILVFDLEPAHIFINIGTNDMNEKEFQLAERHGARYLNLNRGLVDEDGDLRAEYTSDGIHMYGNGYMKVLEELLPVLKGLE